MNSSKKVRLAALAVIVNGVGALSAGLVSSNAEACGANPCGSSGWFNYTLPQSWATSCEDFDNQVGICNYCESKSGVAYCHASATTCFTGNDGYVHVLCEWDNAPSIC